MAAIETFSELADRGAKIGDGAIDDFKGLALIPDGARLSDGASATMEAFEPYIESINWDKEIRGPKVYRDQFKSTYKLMLAIALKHTAKVSEQQLMKEATLAGTDISTYTRQIIRTVLRAWPQIITPQLFPVQPLTQGPSGYVYFEEAAYDSAYASSSPNILPGDLASDLAKFNSGFSKQVNQLDLLGAMKLLMQRILVEAQTYGLSAITSLQAEEDFASQYGSDLNTTLGDRMVYYLKLVIDRAMINAALAAVPAANAFTWKRAPTLNSVAFANQLPSEKAWYHESIWSDAIVPAITAIYALRYVRPNWIIAGPNAAADLMKAQGFVLAADGGNLNQLRDFGSLDAGGMRLIIDPWMDTNTILLGYRPMADMEPAIIFCPYRPIQFMDDWVDPSRIKRTRGAYTRFGIAKPDASVPESLHLGDAYATITVSDAA